MKSSSNRFVVALGLGLVLSTGLVACKQSAKPGDTKAPVGEATIDAPTTTVTVVPTPDVVTLTGMVIADTTSRVAADMGGKILAVYVDRGERVKAGQVLARLDVRSAALSAREAQANLAGARAQQKMLQDECGRSQSLFDKGAITRSQFDRDQTSCTAAGETVAAAAARTAMVSKSISDGSVRAPFDGLITQRLINAGEWAQPGTGLFVLVDDSPLKVELSVAEALVPDVREGQVVTITSVAFPGKTFAATITRKNGEVSRQSRALIAEAELAPQPDLVPGMFAEAQITKGQSDRPTIPRAAIKRRGSSERVFVIVDGVAEERVIRTGPSVDPDRATIAAGLVGGELIIARVDPKDERIVDGVRIKGAPVATAAPTSPTTR